MSAGKNILVHGRFSHKGMPLYVASDWYDVERVAFDSVRIGCKIKRVEAMRAYIRRLQSMGVISSSGSHYLLDSIDYLFP